MNGREARFVHLHLHTQYSLLDSTIRIDELMDQVAELEMPAVAVTDHGNLSAAVKFYHAAVSRGIRPVLGCEVYVARDQKTATSKKPYNHLVLLAENDQGWRNLCRLVSLGYLEGFYYKPRVTKEQLASYSQGLIALSACLSGEVPELVLLGNLEEAIRAASELREIFGPDSFFLEIQDHGLEREQQVREGLLKVSKATGIPLVATNDCHFHRREDLEAHQALIAIGRNRTLDELENFYAYNENFHVRSQDEMLRLFKEYPGACERTVEIASRCHVRLESDSVHLPSYPVPDGHTPDSYLRLIAEEGLERRLKRKAGIGQTEREKYRKRLEHELGIISKMGFPGYFLVVWDFISHAKNKGIPVGPGRGSAAGSLVSYALGITDIDPLEHGLLFERFLNPERISLPDIDIDFCQRRRDEVIDYVRKRYGEDSVSQIATFSLLKARSAVRDVGRVMGFSFGEVDRIAKLIPEELGTTIKSALEESPKLKELAEGSPTVRQMLSIAARIEGLARHCGVHAAGVVIAPEPLINLVPLYKTGRGEVTTQFDKDDVERLGLLKMDFLGLRTLTVISDTVQLISEAGLPAPDLESIPLDDPEVFRLFSSGDTDGIFQFESAGMREMLRKVKPGKLSDLAALNALYRPGPMQFIDEYAAKRHGEKPVTYIFPELEEILGETYGIIIYQEQVMRIAVTIAGFPMAKADTLRKAMAKKKRELLDKLEHEFIEGAVKRGHPRDKVEELWRQIGPFAQYGFNKSHSVAYAHVAYLTAYLKAHYPAFFMAAMLTSEAANTDKLAQHLEKTKQMGIEILPPDINRSKAHFSVEDGAVRFGLAAIKGVGEAALAAILNARETGGDFTSVSDLVRRVDSKAVNQKVLECLVKAGCFDSLGVPRGPLLDSLESLISQAATEREDQERGVRYLFEAPASDSIEERIRSQPEAPKEKLLAWEKEVLGLYFKGHPLDSYSEQLKRFATCDVPGLADAVASGEKRVAVGGLVTGFKERSRRRGGGNQQSRRWAEFWLEDPGGRVRVVMFAEAYQKAASVLEEGKPVLVVGSPRGEADSVELVGEVVYPLDGLEKVAAKGVEVRVNLDAVDKQSLEELKELLLAHPGKLPVFFELVRPGKFRARFGGPEVLSVAPDGDLFERLEQLLGRSCARLLLPANGVMIRS